MPSDHIWFRVPMSLPRRHRCAKILATLGPSTSTREQIAKLVDAGADAFRFNFSHGSHEQHAERYRNVRAIEEATGRPIAVVVDLQGPKLRVGRFRDGSVELHAGDGFRLDLNSEAGDQQRVHLPHPEIYRAAQPDTELLLDDGRIRLRVTEVRDDALWTTVLAGGTLSDSKGVNLPNTVLGLSAITAQAGDRLSASPIRL
jgi:pyruvate kinase